MHWQFLFLVGMCIVSLGVFSDCDGLVAQALLTANFEAAVEVCLHNDRMAEAIILALAGGPELLAQTQKKFFNRNTKET